MFAKDSRTENLLSHHGLAWKWSNKITFDKLVPTWDSAQHGRSGKAKWDDIVLEYASRGEQGSAAPGPILRKTGRGLDVLDGVQRLAAEKLLGSTQFSAYIVETDSDLLSRKVRILANHLLAGHPEKSDWTRMKAIEDLCIEGGMSCAEVAKAGGWPLKLVEEDKEAIIWGFAIRCIGGPQQLNKGLLLTVSKHARMDDMNVADKPVAAFFHDLKNCKFTNGEAEPLISDFFQVKRNNRNKLYDQFEDHLETFRASQEVSTRLAGRTRSKRNPDIKLRMSMKTVLTATKDLIDKQTYVLYVDEFFQLWNQVRDNLQVLSQRKTKPRN